MSGSITIGELGACERAMGLRFDNLIESDPKTSSYNLILIPSTADIMTSGGEEESNGRLGVPPPLSRNNSHTSQRSIHSQRSHSSQTHHVTPSDPSTLLNLLHTMSSEESTVPERHGHHPHVHPQHGNLFVAQDGPTGMPSFEEMAVTEERDWMEGDAEDQERSEEEERERGQGPVGRGNAADRRKSVTFQEGPAPHESSSSAHTLHEEEPSRVHPTEQDPLLQSKQDAQIEGEDPIYDPTKDPEEWARIREGSIARRSRWRRPGPYW